LGGKRGAKETAKRPQWFLRTAKVPGLFDLYKSVKRDHGGSDCILSEGLAPPLCSGGLPALSPPPETFSAVTRWGWAPVPPAQAYHGP